MNHSIIIKNMNKSFEKMDDPEDNFYFLLLHLGYLTVGSKKD